jgi:membrane protease YdiL (CAAX protease family)
MPESDKKHVERVAKADFGSPLGVIGRLLFIFVASQFAAVIFLGLFAPIAGIGTDLENSAATQFVYVLISEALAVGLVYFFLKLRDLKFADIGLARRPSWGDLKSGLLGFGAFYVILIVSTIILAYLIPSFDVDQAQDVGFNTLNTSTDRLIAFIALVLIPPIGEEILMRGYLYSGLRSRLSFVWAMLITSALFGLAHLEFGREAPLVWVAAVHTFILSMVLVYVRERTGALYAAILIHLLNNAVAFAVNF